MNRALCKRKGRGVAVGLIALQLCVSPALSQQKRTQTRATTPAKNSVELVVQLGHSSVVTSVAFSRDGHYVMTGGADGTAVLWEAETGRLVRRFKHGGRYVLTVAFSGDGRYVMTGGNDETALKNPDTDQVQMNAVLWEAETGTLVNSFAGFPAALSPEGRYVMTGCADGTAVLWEAQTGKLVRTLEGHSGGVTSVAFSLDGRYVLTGGGDKTARLWEVETGKEARSLEGHSGPVYPVAISPDGRYALTVSDNSTVWLWETGTGKELRQFETNLLNRGDSIAFSPDGQYVLAGSAQGYGMLWEADTGKLHRRFADPDFLSVTSVCFSPDGRYVLTGGEIELFIEGHGAGAALWDTKTGKPIRFFNGDSDAVTSVAVAPDDRYLVAAGEDGKAVLWEPETGKPMRYLDRFSRYGFSVAISPDGQYVGRGGFEGVAGLWEAATGKQVRSFKGHSGRVTSVAFSPDGRSVLTGSDDKTARLWDVETEKELHRFEVHSDAIDPVAFSPDGHSVLTVRDDGIIELWKAAPGKQKHFEKSVDGESRFRGHSGRVLSVAFSPDVRQVFTGSDDNTAQLWDFETGKRLRQFEGHFGWINSVAFSRDGRYVLTGSDDKTARLWNRQTGAEVKSFQGHSGFVSSVAFFRDGKYVLTAGTDSTTRIWDTSSGRELCQLITFRDGNWAVVDHEGRFDTNNLEEINGLHWIMPDERMKPLPLEIFMRDYYEPRLLPRILAGEQFKPVRALADLNRVQPCVKITSIERQKDSPDLVTVTIEVGKAKSERQKDEKGNPRETGVFDLRLFRDGQIVGQYADGKPQALPQSAGDKEEPFTWRTETQVKLDANGKRTIKFEKIKLPHKADVKQVEFSAYAFNEDRVKSQTDRKRFEVPKGLTPSKGRAYIISVGVNSFENQEWNLEFAANDARLTDRVLFDKLDQIGQYEEVVHVPLISDADAGENRATKANFKAVQDLLSGKKVDPELSKAIPNADKIKEARPEDLVLISFSSHGFADRSGNFYLFPADISKGSQRRISDQMKQNLISSKELSLWLRDVDAGDMVLVIDACNSAGTVKGEGGEEFKPGPMGSRGLGQLAYDKGMRILAASQADDVAIESRQLKQGLLTYALIRNGIDARQGDEDKDGAITLGESLKYAEARVPQLYEEMKKGNVQSFGIEGARSEVVQVVGHNSLRKERSQRPSLFDFTRKKSDVMVVGPPVRR